MRFTEACLLKTENNMTTLSEPLVTPKYGKWRQLVLGLICMAAISSPQYVWTLLTKPLAAKLGVGLPELQVTFSLLIILQTFFSPFQGRLVEKFGPRRLIAIGTVMAGMSWVLSAQVNGLATLWLVYGCMGGLGTGIVYIGVVGLMVKWFPQQRGFAAGAVAALLYQHTHGWHVVFSCAIGLDFVTAALALWVLKPWRARFIRQHS